MPRKDADALAVWDARAREMIGRLDEVLDSSTASPHHSDFLPAPDPDRPADGLPLDPRLGRLARRVAGTSTPPPGEILHPEPVVGAAWRRDPAPRAVRPNMGAQEERIDHWDAYVCRFDDDDVGAVTAFP